MTGTDDLRVQEYAALMNQLRDLERTSQLCWVGAGVASTVLLSSGLAERSPGLMLPVEFCAAFAFYTTLQARRQSQAIEGYLRTFHEQPGEGAQWWTRLARLHELPGVQGRTEWLPLALANATTLAAIAFSWVFASGAAHGELMAGITTMAGVAFAAHSLVEHLRLDQAQSARAWEQVNDGLREVTAGTKRAANFR